MSLMVAPRTVFLGVTGASGAPYALRLAQELAVLGCSLSLSLSEAGAMVVRHELSLAASGSAGVAAEFLARAHASADVYDADDLTAPVSSGSAFPDAAVICPCSLSTAAHIALGTSVTLIHRAGAVALKERRPLVLVPREVPLSSIHLRRLLEVSEAGAIVVPPMPAFYTRPTSLEEGVDYVVGKVLAVLGFQNGLSPAWGGDIT